MRYSKVSIYNISHYKNTKDRRKTCTEVAFVPCWVAGSHFTCCCARYISGISTQPHAKCRCLQCRSHSTTALPAWASRGPNDRPSLHPHRSWRFLPSSFSVLAYLPPGPGANMPLPPLRASTLHTCWTGTRH